MPYYRILIIGDDSPSSIRAVKEGYILAEALKADVALVGIIREINAMGNVDAGIFPEQAAQQLKLDMEELLHSLYKDYGKNIPTEFFTPEGEIKETILNLAREWNATLIVAGTHGRKGLNRLLMGSVADSILRVSSIPVLVVPMEKE